MSEPPAGAEFGDDGFAHLALRVADHVPAMLAYWTAEQVCLFANEAYRSWFGKSPAEIVGSTIRDLLGPLYEPDRPYIERVLDGETQVFERTIPQPGGGVRESLATYTPDVEDGVVRGFFVHVADVTAMKELEREHERVIHKLEVALGEVRTLRGLLPICMHCKNIKDADGTWVPVEAYVRVRTEARFSHGICPQCMATHHPEIDSSAL